MRFSIGFPNTRTCVEISLVKRRFGQALVSILGLTPFYCVRSNVLQPGVLANSIVSVWVTRAAHGSALANLAVVANSPEELVDDVALRVLGRWPTAAERSSFVGTLRPGFATRQVPAAEVMTPPALPPLPAVSWSNHLMPDSTTVMMELEKRARAGPPPDPRLRPAWREAFEDVVWTLVNTREFVWLR